MKTTAPSWYANIWIAGDYGAARAACRDFCTEGLCVTITPTAYIYTGGAEDGVCVRMINYPRFPKPLADLKATAMRLADFLRFALRQHSYSVEFPDETIWDTTREQDEKLQP